MTIDISWMIWVILAWFFGFGDLLAEFGGLFGG